MQVFVCYFYLIRSQSIYYVFPICDCVHVNTHVAWRFVILHDHNFHPRKTWRLKNTLFCKWKMMIMKIIYQPSFFLGFPAILICNCQWGTPAFLPSTHRFLQAAAEHYPGMRWRRTDLVPWEWKQKTPPVALNIHIDIDIFERSFFF